MLAIVVNCDANTILTIKEVTTCPDQVGIQPFNSPTLICCHGRLTSRYLVSGQYARWQGITAVDVITEICICALPIAFVWPTNMSLYIKFQVFLAFAFRLPLVFLSAVHLSLFKTYPQSSQPQLAIAGSLILQQVMLTYSLISATIPNLKSFMKSFSVGMGVSIGFIRSDLDESSNAYRIRSFEPHSQSTGNRSQRRWRGDDVTLISADPGNESEGHEMRPIFRPDQVAHEVTIKGSSDDRSAGTAEDERAVSRSGSQDMIIKKEVVWNVYHEQMDGSSK